MENHVWKWAQGIGRGKPFEELTGLVVRDVLSHRVVEDIRTAHMICMCVAVDEMCDGLTSDAMDCRLELIAQCRRAIDYDDTVGADQKHSLVGTVGDEISAIT